jgi:two-component system, chemotaxis family, response regulator WspF
VSDRKATVVAIGASAGGPGAVAEILRELPAGFAGAVVVVQHIDFGFAPALVSWFNQLCRLPVSLARDGHLLRGGEVTLVAGPDHMVLGPGWVLRSTHGADHGPYCPSIDVFFNSVAARARAQAVGVVLTGMGRDGARGLKAMRQAGAFTIAQNRETSAVYGMPKAAVALEAAELVLPLPEIATCLVSLVPVSPLFKRSHRDG